MAGRKGDGLVEKKKLGVPAGSHGCAFPAAELGLTDEPALLARPLPAQCAVLVVQAAAVSHEEAAGGGRDDLAEGSHAVLKRHGGVTAY